jgi:hypothetical protein
VEASVTGGEAREREGNLVRPDIDPLGKIPCWWRSIRWGTIPLPHPNQCSTSCLKIRRIARNRPFSGHNRRSILADADELKNDTNGKIPFYWADLQHQALGKAFGVEKQKGKLFLTVEERTFLQWVCLWAQIFLCEREEG